MNIAEAHPISYKDTKKENRMNIRYVNYK